MSLQIHRAERADRLVEALGELLSTPLPDPFATEIVSVPTPGVERWLAQRLSRRLGATPGRQDGICAGVDFCSPRRLVARAVGEVLGRDPELDPWRPERAVWPLLRVIDGCRGESWAAAAVELPRRPGPGTGHRSGTRRTPLVDRPAPGRSLRRVRGAPARHGHRLGPGPRCRQRRAPTPSRPGLAGRAVAPARGRGGRATPGRGDRQRGRRCCAPIPSRTGLPARLSVFGVTRLEPDHRLVLAALAEQRDVHLWLTHPSPGLWDQLAATEPLVSPPIAGATIGAKSASSTDCSAYLGPGRPRAPAGTARDGHPDRRPPPSRRHRPRAAAHAAVVAAGGHRRRRRTPAGGRAAAARSGRPQCAGAL